MKAAVLREYGTPQFGEFNAPAPVEGAEVITVLAAGVNHLDLGIASGAIPTLKCALPSVPGTDGVGKTANGQRVYFDRTIAPFGALAEQALIATGTGFPVRGEIDDATAAALGNAGLAAMIPLGYHAKIRSTDTVVIVGATGSVGRLAVQIAKSLGAGRVVAVGRNAERLAELLPLGADAIVTTESGAVAEQIREATGGGASVIVDLLWGAPSLAAMQAATFGAQVFQIGQKAAPELSLPASLIRSKGLRIRGIAGVHEPADRRAEAYERLLGLAAAGKLTVSLERVPLAQIAVAWRRQAEGASQKQVIIPR